MKTPKGMCRAPLVYQLVIPSPQRSKKSESATLSRKPSHSMRRDKQKYEKQGKRGKYRSAEWTQEENKKRTRKVSAEEHCCDRVLLNHDVGMSVAQARAAASREIDRAT
jgi:hypothetical protein